MKFHSSVALSFLIMIFLLSSSNPGFSTSTHPTVSYGIGANQPLEVWFDSPQLLTYDPCSYLLVVNAKTSTALTITYLHWDFGDGATLDVPYSSQSYVTDTRTHIYQSSGTYNVTVTAYDTTGNSGMSSVTLSNVTPGSCAQDSGTDNSPAVSNIVSQNPQTNLQLPPKIWDTPAKPMLKGRLLQDGVGK